jgi:uncharacterized protein
MNVTVIGATGRIGKRVAGMLADAGHDVRGVNRRPDRAAAVLAGVRLRTYTADTGDEASLMPALEGADTAVLATAPTREDPAAYLAQTGNVLRAARRAKVARLLAVSSYVALLAPDGRTVLEAEPAHPYFRPIEEVYPAQVALFRAETELNWLLVAPPAELYPYGEVTRRYRVAVDVLVVTDPASPHFKQTSVLSMEDLAAFVTDQVEHPSYHRQLVTLAY